MPTVPPSSQPTASTVTSRQVRTRRMERPVRRASPVISPSRGPGPKCAPMYMPVAIPQSTMPVTIAPIRQPIACTRGSQSRLRFIDTPMSTTLLIVPRPGSWRSGIHSSRTAAPTTITTVPIASPRWRARP